MVKTKVVAVLLGPTGVGIIGLLNAPLQLIASVTGLGLPFSAVREISEAHGNNDKDRIARIIISFRRWAWFTGLLGVAVTMLFAPLLSKWTFGNSDYVWAFRWLSVTLLLLTINKSQIAIIQGTRRLKDLAQASIYGTLIGLFTAVPLYYFFGTKGIVPSIIIAAVSSLFLSWYFSRRIEIESIKISYNEIFRIGGQMLGLGAIITITGLVSTLTGYILSAFISRTGGVDQVGLYNAGWSVVGQSTSLVFTAMATDFYPRLAAVNRDNFKLSELVNQQAQMVQIILAPILILLIGLMPVIVRILYTPEFSGIIKYTSWMLSGILLKGLLWPVGFIFPAKGDLKLFGFIEMGCMVFNILTNVAGYHFFGLEGLGVSFIINYLFGFSVSYFYAKRKYEFKYNKLTLIEFARSLILVSAVFLITYFVDQPFSYYYSALLLILSLVYFLFALNNKIGLQDLLSKAGSYFKGGNQDEKDNL